MKHFIMLLILSILFMGSSVYGQEGERPQSGSRISDSDRPTAVPTPQENVVTEESTPASPESSIDTAQPQPEDQRTSVNDVNDTENGNTTFKLPKKRIFGIVISIVAFFGVILVNRIRLRPR